METQKKILESEIFRKIYFHGRIQRDILFVEKVVLSYSCKTRHMLGENWPVATPTTKDSGMFFNEQSDTPGENLTSVQPESSVETQPSVESQQTSSTTRGEGGGRRLRGGFFFEGGEGGS